MTNYAIKFKFEDNNDDYILEHIVILSVDNFDNLHLKIEDYANEYIKNNPQLKKLSFNAGSKNDSIQALKEYSVVWHNYDEKQ